METNNFKDDLEEIFSHIQEIKNQEQSKNIENNELNEIDIIKKNVEVIAGDTNITDTFDDDLFEIVSPVNNAVSDISQMNINSDITICDICHERINLQDNLSGLSIKGEYFACEKCCYNASKEDLEYWTGSRSSKQKDIQPIALFLMYNKNKEDLFK